MTAKYFRDVATELERGICRFGEVDLAMMWAYAVIGETAYPSAHLFLIPDSTEMLVLWLAISIQEDAERAARIDEAIATLRELCC